MMQRDTRNQIALQTEAIRLYTEEGFTTEQVGKHLHKGREWVKIALAGIPKRRPRPPSYQPPPLPRDTRTQSQRLMGEPVFERSALYQKMQGEA